MTIASKLHASLAITLSQSQLSINQLAERGHFITIKGKSHASLAITFSQS